MYIQYNKWFGMDEGRHFVKLEKETHKLNDIRSISNAQFYLVKKDGKYGIDVSFKYGDASFNLQMSLSNMENRSTLYPFASIKTNDDTMYSYKAKEELKKVCVDHVMAIVREMPQFRLYFLTKKIEINIQ